MPVNGHPVPPPGSLGRSVHYVVADGTHRLAFIVGIPGGEPTGLLSDLAVLPDPSHDDVPSNHALEFPPAIAERLAAPVAYHAPTIYIVAVRQDEETKAPGTWHHQERV